MALEITGTIEQILPLQTGTTGAGKEWKKQLFLVKTEAEFNNLFCFEIFGDEKVENFIKYNKVGNSVKVDFNVNTNEWQGKYFTSLSAWKVFKTDSAPQAQQSAPITTEEVDDDLPY